jgi:hypothetical protein
MRKWRKSHLGSDDSGELMKLGFDKIFFKHSNAPGHWNMNLNGEDIDPQEGVGDILEKLREHNIEEDTLIFVIGDNDAPL